MNEIIAKLASACGISPEQVEKGLGAILAFLKSKLPPETFAKISAVIPGADGLTTASEGTAGEGGVMGALTGAIGKMFGGGTGDLVSKFAQSGMSAEQIQSFLPKVLEFLKSHLPPEVMEKVIGLLPAPKDAAS